MNTKISIKILLGIGCLAILSTVLFAENITLNTYYPSPMGSFDRIKLVPRSSIPLNPDCNEQGEVGIMYYDNGAGAMAEGVHVCQKLPDASFHWVFVSPPVTWGAVVASNEKVVCIKANGNLGVCTNNPSADGKCGCT